ncbi:site-specific integrase [Micromonospora sp. MED01]|uniref:tyrosine-type recombinase/integrase n=1 Tax=Micromonospora alfalfae TaxID=2911212 RepID=UPI001EE93B12|nr:tyrosine-type recombinase/integrase [Micromonospora alfalfae]MCG5462177.1 site-specific integrase [Micromonospora alfalfae]
MASIKKRPNGKYRARYRDDSGKEHARHFDRRVDAQRWLDEVTAASVTGQYVDPRAGLVTFTRYFGEWSERQLWAAGTDKAMRLAARCTTFGDVPMKALRRSHIETWIKTLQTRGLAASTIKTRFNNVRSVLRAAVRDLVIVRDPSEGVTLPRARRAAVAMEIPTPAQVGALLGAAPPWFRTFISLAAFAGLRLGEAAGGQLGDIDFLRRTLQVTRQVQRGPGGTVIITPPKYGSERAVYLADALVKELSVHATSVAEKGPRWLFLGEGDDPMHQNTIGYWWRKTCRAAGVENTTLHDLRHFYASGLIAQGCDVVTVQRALGHRSATVTLKTYAHLWPTAEDRTRKAADSLILEALADSSRTAGALRVV